MKKDRSSVTNEASVKYQYIAAFVANLLPMGYGVVNGWASPSIALLTSDNSPLPTGKITMDEASWIASLPCMGGLVGNIFYGILTAKFGRKLPMIFMAIPTIISWLLILYAQNVYYLYASRLLIGTVGGGIFIVVPAFLSEIAIDRIRGFIGSTLVLCCNFGCLLAFVFGGYLDFYVSPKFVIALTVSFGILFIFFPESPTVLVKQNKFNDAEKSIKFYHNLSESDADNKALQMELTKLKCAAGNGENDEKSNESTSFKWTDLSVAPGKKAMLIGLVLALLNQFCGAFAMLNYTANIFETAGSSMSPNAAAIVVGFIQLVGSYVPSILVERSGRKFLFVVSTIGVALGLSCLGAYMMLKTWGYDVDSVNWIPVACFSFVIFIANWAILTLPFLVISEIMPEKLKNFGPSCCLLVLWSSAFLVVKTLPLLTAYLQFHGTMFFFAGICVASVTFIIFNMPETKGRSHDEIMNLLRKI